MVLLQVYMRNVIMERKASMLVFTLLKVGIEQIPEKERNKERIQPSKSLIPHLLNLY